MADIIYIDGIGKAYKAALAKRNISSIEALHAYFQNSPDGVQQLAAQLRVDADEVQHWARHAEVWQLGGMTESYFRMLGAAHVRSLRRLTSFQAKVLQASLAAADKREGIAGTPPSVELVQQWLNEAQAIVSKQAPPPTMKAPEAAAANLVTAPAVEAKTEKPKADAPAQQSADAAPADAPAEKKSRPGRKPKAPAAETPPPPADDTAVKVEHVSAGSTGADTKETKDSPKNAQDPKPVPLLQVIVEYAKKAAAAAAIPVPIGDIMAVTEVQLSMVKEIAERKAVKYDFTAASAAIRGLAPLQSSWGTLASAIKIFPYMGTVAGMVGGAYAHATTTYAIGFTLMDHFNAGGNLGNFSPAKAKSKYDNHYKTGQEMLKTVLKDKVGMK